MQDYYVFSTFALRYIERFRFKIRIPYEQVS